MNDKERAVMQQALEALESYKASYGAWPAEEAAIIALRTVLEQVELVQEPVGEVLPDWSSQQECIVGTCVYLNDLGKNLPVGTKLYTRPPQREQVLLTDVEIDRIDQSIPRHTELKTAKRLFARAIENASLEKNK